MPVRFRRPRRYRRVRIPSTVAMRGMVQRFKSKTGQAFRKPHKFTRTMNSVLGLVDDNTQIPSYAGTLTQGYFSLDQLPNYAEFTALFDQYKIYKIKQTFIYTANSASQPDSSTSQTLIGNMMPTMYSVLDYDDGTALSTAAGSLAEPLQYESVKLHRLDKNFTRTFYPKVASVVYKSGGFSAYATPQFNPWIDCSNADVQYYAHKFGFDKHVASGTNDPLGYVQIFTKVYFLCRDTR